MKKIIGVALFFLVAAAPALAGGNSGGGSSSAGGGWSSGGGMRTLGGGSPTQSFPGFGAQPAPRSFAPREAPMKFPAEPDHRRTQPRWVSNDYINTQSRCPKNPYQQPPAVNGCAANPWVFYAFPSDDF